MTAQISFIEGRCVHQKSNALKIDFVNGPGQPFAVGTQGGGDGKGAKLATLFGFKNGGTGRHVVRYADGRELVVASRDSAPTVVTQADGSVLATVQRGDTSVALGTDDAPILHFAAATGELNPSDAYQLTVSDPSGAAVADLTIVRTASGWATPSLTDVLTFDAERWLQRTGAPLTLPFQGTRLGVTRPLRDLEQDVLLAACVDIVIGLRPYTAQMR